MSAPRVNGRFTKGASGNPAGRPRRRADAVPAVAPAETVREFRRDGWVNSASGHGTARDRRTLTSYGVDIVTDIEALQLWRTEFLAASIIEQGPKDALRRPWHLKCEDKDLDVAICKQAEELGLDEVLQDAWMKELAYGGAAIMPVLSGALDDLSKPLDPRGIVSVDAFHVFEPQELSPAAYYSDIRSPRFRRPSAWRLMPISSGRSGFIGTQIIHDSRLIIFPGISVSTQTQPGQREGWGDSVLCRPKQVISDFGLAWGSAATLLHEHGRGTWSIDGLSQMLADEQSGLEEFDRHIAAQAMAWSTLKMNTIDAKDKYQRDQGSLGGLAEVLNEFKVLMAAAARRPVSVLMGQSQSGLRTGDDDTRTWYATVEGDRAKHLKPRHEACLKLMLLASSGPTGGREPDAWSVEYPPLWSPTEKEIADTRKVDADRAVALINAQVVSPEEVTRSFYGGDTYSGDIKIDWEAREKQVAAQAVAPGDLDGESVNALAPEDEEVVGDNELDQLDSMMDGLEVSEDEDDDLEDDEEEDDTEDDLEDDEEDQEDDTEDPEDDDEERADEDARLDAFSQPRDASGKFASVGSSGGPIAIKVGGSKATVKAAKTAIGAEAKLTKATARVKAAKAKATQAHRKSREAVKNAVAAAKKAHAKPTRTNVNAAVAAASKANRASEKSKAASAALGKHQAAHATAKAKHVEAKAALKTAIKNEKSAAKAAKAAKTQNAEPKVGAGKAAEPANPGKPVKQEEVAAQKPATKPKTDAKPMSGADFDDWRKKNAAGMSRDQVDHVEKYTGEAYKEINGSLRSGAIPANHAETVKHIDAAFEKSRSDTDVVVYRGISSEKIVSQLEVGTTFMDRGFVSTSANRKIAEDNFADGGGSGTALMHITVPKGSKSIPVPRSNYPKEREVLLPRGSKFVIHKVEHVDGTKIVHAHLVED